MYQEMLRFCIKVAIVMLLASFALWVLTALGIVDFNFGAKRPYGW